MMKRKLVLIVAVLALSFYQGFGKGKFKQEQFVNLLNIEVGYSVSPNGYFFSDLGDWHGYGFNNPSDLSLTGGFRGPAFAGERSLRLQWLSDCFEKLTIIENICPVGCVNSYKPVISLSNLERLLCLIEVQ